MPMAALGKFPIAVLRQLSVELRGKCILIYIHWVTERKSTSPKVEDSDSSLLNHDRPDLVTCPILTPWWLGFGDSFWLKLECLPWN